MVQIAGKYEKTQSVGVVEFFVARGVPEDRAKEMEKDKTLEIKLDGDEVAFIYEKNTFNCTLGKQVEGKSSRGVTYKNTAKLNGNTLTIDTVHPDGKTSSSDYLFSDGGLEIILKGSDGGQAKTVYKRL